MDRQFLHIPSKPQLTIKSFAGKNIGRCLNSYSYEIVSRVKLKENQLKALSTSGIISSGQMFYVHSKCDGTEEPFEYENVPCVEYVNGEPQKGPAINPYTGNPYGPSKYSYYKYNVEVRVDSSD